MKYHKYGIKQAANNKTFSVGGAIIMNPDKAPAKTPYLLSADATALAAGKTPHWWVVAASTTGTVGRNVMT